MKALGKVQILYEKFSSLCARCGEKNKHYYIDGLSWKLEGRAFGDRKFFNNFYQKTPIRNFLNLREFQISR